MICQAVLYTLMELCPENNTMSMQLPPASRKYMLILHLLFSIGWFGAVAAFLIPAVNGLTSTVPEKVRASYIVMEAIAWYSILPLSIGALITGILQSIGTPWGLFRYYWIVVKLLLTLASTGLLLLHLQPINQLGEVAVFHPLTPDDLQPQRIQVVVDAASALCVLLAATILSISKPWGKIPPRPFGKTTSYIIFTLLSLLLLFGLLHLFMRGHPMH